MTYSGLIGGILCIFGIVVVAWVFSRSMVAAAESSRADLSLIPFASSWSFGTF